MVLSICCPWCLVALKSSSFWIFVTCAACAILQPMQSYRHKAAWFFGFIQLYDRMAKKCKNGIKPPTAVQFYMVQFPKICGSCSLCSWSYGNHAAYVVQFCRSVWDPSHLKLQCGFMRSIWFRQVFFKTAHAQPDDLFLCDSGWSISSLCGSITPLLVLMWFNYSFVGVKWISQFKSKCTPFDVILFYMNAGAQDIYWWIIEIMCPCCELTL